MQRTNADILHILYNDILHMTNGGLQGTVSEDVEKRGDRVDKHQMFENITSIRMKGRFLLADIFDQLEGDIRRGEILLRWPDILLGENFVVGQEEMKKFFVDLIEFI